MASETIPGGAYQVGDQWVNAWGVPLEPDQVAEAERVQAERQARAEEQERQRLQAEAQANPLTRALAGLQAPQRVAQQPEAEPKARR